METFILKIFFSGLIAFLPSADGTDLTVLLVNTPHEYALADGTALAHHRPLLLARAASCEGTCTTDDHTSIAQYMFAAKTQAEATSALNGALLGGGAWQLSGSDLTLNGPNGPLSIVTGVRARNDDGTLKLVPASAAEREDFSWVADATDLYPASNGFKTALKSSEPPPGCTIAARLTLHSGRVFTYSLVKIDGKARPVHFRKPSGEGPDASYTQALATWVEAEIHVPGDSVEIVDQSFSDSTSHRSMRLHPQDGVVEMAVLNLPPFVAPAADAPAPSPQPGQHFQIYWDLVKNPPPRADRLVPHQALTPSDAEPQVDWGSVHPRAALWSNLLEQLGMSPRGKGPYEIALCPIIKE